MKAFEEFDETINNENNLPVLYPKTHKKTDAEYVLHESTNSSYVDCSTLDDFFKWLFYLSTSK